MREVARLHVAALPHTISSRVGVSFVELLYQIVRRIGYVKTVEKRGQVVGVVSGIGKLILTLVVHPDFQHQGIGKKLIDALPGERWVYTEKCSSGFYKKVRFARVGQIGKTIVMKRIK